MLKPLLAGMLAVLLSAAPASAATAKADLVIAAAAAPAEVPAPGGAATLTVDRRNDGSRTSQEAVVKIAVPAGAQFAGDGLSIPAGWNCDRLSSGTCTHSPLAAGAAAESLRLPLSLPAGTAGTSVVITATVSGGPESTTANNSGRAVVRYVPGVVDLAFDPAASTQELLAGEQARLTSVVRNTGNITSGDITVVADLPAGMSGVEVANDGWECTDTLTCRHAPLLPGQTSAPVNFVANLVDAQAGDTLTLTATVSTTVAETGLDDNTARTTVTVVAGAVVRGTVWVDADYNGVRDTGDPGAPVGSGGIDSVVVVPQTPGEPGYLATVNPDGTYRAYVRAGSFRVEFAVQDPYEFIDSPDSDLIYHWNETGGWNNVGHTDWFTVQAGDEVVLDAGVD